MEEKGLAVAVHTRRMSDLAAAFARLEPSSPTPPNGTA